MRERKNFKLLIPLTLRGLHNKLFNPVKMSVATLFSRRHMALSHRVFHRSCGKPGKLNGHHHLTLMAVNFDRGTKVAEAAIGG